MESVATKNFSLSPYYQKVIQGLHSLKIEVFALESRYEKGEEESVALRHPVESALKAGSFLS